eukprot:7309871-Prymnesium_polylepis.1
MGDAATQSEIWRERVRHEQHAYELSEQAKIRHMNMQPTDLAGAPQQVFAAYPSLTHALMFDSSMLKATPLNQPPRRLPPVMMEKSFGSTRSTPRAMSSHHSPHSSPRTWGRAS